MRKIIVYTLFSVIVNSAFSQNQDTPLPQKEFFIKGGIGTSWIILPKVFLLDENNPTTNAQVLPATNGFTGFVGFQTVFNIGNNWAFAPELDLTYLNGEIRFDRQEIIGTDTLRQTTQNSQSYVRAEIPIHFAMTSRDGFWVSFGPSVYFTLFDNKGFEKSVYEVSPNPNLQLESGNPIGIRFRLAIYAPVGNRSYIDIKFESDLGKHFKYENDTYDAKFSYQNVSVGYGYRLNKQ